MLVGGSSVRFSPQLKFYTYNGATIPARNEILRRGELIERHVLSFHNKCTEEDFLENGTPDVAQEGALDEDGYLFLVEE